MASYVMIQRREQGEDWEDYMSLGWFDERPLDALAIFRDAADPGEEFRAVRRTEEVIDG